MHLMALGAFLLDGIVKKSQSLSTGLNAPFGARCFLTDIDFNQQKYLLES